MTKKVELFIVGAVKSGTTSLVEYLKKSSRIYAPPMKEPFFFIEDDIGVTSFCEYESLYEKAKIDDVKVDASTGYLFSRSAALRIREYNPSAKIIIILRNPIDACYSLWRYMGVNGSEKRSFSECIRSVAIPRDNKFGWRYNYSYIDRFLYEEQVSMYTDMFDSVLVLTFEGIVKNPEGELSRVNEFIGLPIDKRPALPRTNEGGEVNSRILHKIRGRQYPFLKKMIPANIRATVRYMLRDLNTKKVPQRSPSIDKEDLGYLVSKFYADVSILSKYGVDTSLWKYFNESS